MYDNSSFSEGSVCLMTVSVLRGANIQWVLVEEGRCVITVLFLNKYMLVMVISTKEANV